MQIIINIMVYRLKAISLFVIGLAVTGGGMVIFLMYPALFSINTKSYSFGIMLAGLLFVAVGSVHGKRTMVSEKKKDAFSETLKKMDKKAGKSSSANDKKKEDEKEEKEEKSDGGDLFSMFRREEEEPPEGKGVVRIYVCPKCGAENPEGHNFCFNCGKKLKFAKGPKKPEKPKAGKGGKK